MFLYNHLRPRYDHDSAPEQIKSKLFRDERVVIGGKEFLDCTFDHVTLVYNGATPVRMIGHTFDGLTVLTSDDPSIDPAIEFVRELREIKQARKP